MLPVGLRSDAEVDARLLTPEWLWCDRNEALVGELVAGLADVGVYSEHFVEDDDGGSRRTFGPRDIGQALRPGLRWQCDSSGPPPMSGSAEA